MLDPGDRGFMRRALRLAERGITQASPNPTVGCVLVKRGKVIGEDWHRYAELDHAEVRALDRAGESARGATAYVTLEPCSHKGRTGPCVASLLRAGVVRIVVAMTDPNPRVRGRGISRLREAGISVEEGLLENEAKRLNEPFACHVTTGLPLVVGKVGMSLDGRIATSSRESRWITSSEAREFAQQLRGRLDAVLVGIGTALEDNPRLTYRGNPARDRPLLRVILDSKLRLPPGASVFESAPDSPVLIFCGPDAPARRRKTLEARGAEIVAVGSRGTELDLERVLEELGKRRVLGLLVEGGSEIHGSFLIRRLFDKFYFIVAPRVLGGTEAVPAIGGRGFRRLEDSERFAILRNFKAGEDRILEAYPTGSRSILSPWRSSEAPPSRVQGPSRTSRRR